MDHVLEEMEEQLWSSRCCRLQDSWALIPWAATAKSPLTLLPVSDHTALWATVPTTLSKPQPGDPGISSVREDLIQSLQHSTARQLVHPTRAGASKQNPTSVDSSPGWQAHTLLRYPQ